MRRDGVIACGAEAAVGGEARRLLEERYDRLLKEHGPALSRVAASYEAVLSRREELAQEIALAIWQALPQFRGDCSERTFVFRIAHNRGLSHAWRRKAAPPEDAAAIEPADPRPSPEEKADAGQRRERLLAAIRSLPVAYRQLLTLTLEELSQAEIAQVLGITENNVAVRLSRAKKALREALGSQP
jgi:RNA polymerase sigma factor (sigma-70 family)